MNIDTLIGLAVICGAVYLSFKPLWGKLFIWVESLSSGNHNYNDEPGGLSYE